AFCESAKRKRNQRELLQPSRELSQFTLEQRNWITHAGSAGHRQERHSEQRRDRNYEFVVWNPIAGKSQIKNQKISLVDTISNLETNNETNVKLKREPGS
ncbi:MAG: hypothetical protein EZS28_052924, partial [Streblomastix strix]